MVSNLIKHSGRIFICMCFLLSCGEGHKTSKDIQIVWATDYTEDGLDFLCNKDTIYIYPNNIPVLKESMRFYALSDQEFSLAKDILNNYFINYSYDIDGNTSEQPFRLRKYFRQYLGYIKKDSLYVHVNLYTHFPTIPDPECLCTIVPSQRIFIYEGNGGRNYGTIVINMRKKKVEYLKLSDTDSNYTIGHYTEKELKVLFPDRLIDQE